VRVVDEGGVAPLDDENGSIDRRPRAEGGGGQTTAAPELPPWMPRSRQLVGGPPLLASDARPRHLPLHDDVAALHLLRGIEHSPQQCRGHREGRIGDNSEGPRWQRQIERVAGHHHDVRTLPDPPVEAARQLDVAFDGPHLAGVLGEWNGQCTRPCSDLDDEVAPINASSGDESGGEVWASEEVLPEVRTPCGAPPVPGHGRR